MGKPAKRNWKRVVELWRKSGLSKADFCRRNNIPGRRFSYYSIKFKAFSRPKKPAKNVDAASAFDSNKHNFAEVICPAPASMVPADPEPLILRLDCGASIEIVSDFNPELLRKILKAAASL
ncbi:MAG: hypothetical protein WCT05_13560 [Lentisphaeria bacterium]